MPSESPSHGDNTEEVDVNTTQVPFSSTSPGLEAEQRGAQSSSLPTLPQPKSDAVVVGGKDVHTITSINEPPLSVNSFLVAVTTASSSCKHSIVSNHTPIAYTKFVDLPIQLYTC